MTESRLARVKEIFVRTSELEDAERERVLAAECGEDAELRSLVESLLDSQEAAPDGFLDPPTEVVEAANQARARGTKIEHATKPGEVPASAGLQGELPGQKFGRYTLVRQVGEGGFGIVWMAEQSEPIRRRVALKLIKLGMDTRQVLRRFDVERQAIAMMDHPNIARVLDAGSTEAGRPFFVMDFVEGKPILEYCDEHELDTAARLEMFCSICRAIHHAHQKGIIHRDVKPTNVLVASSAGQAIPKVIDFGIAKATDADPAYQTLLTQQRQLVGTPAYMSPEQAEMGGTDLDTRTDIYSLGVLLYELLTGTTPFDSEQLTKSGLAEIARTIREVEAPKPSTRVSTMGRSAIRIAERQRVDVHGLKKLLSNDLDWIVMMCLEKDRERRYQSANDLATDIQRYLSNEPVLAGPPSLSYRAQKFFKRNRLAIVLIATLVASTVLLLTAGIAWTTWKNRLLSVSNASLDERNIQLATERAAAENALEDVERLSDARVLDDLEARAANELWPAVPAKLDLMEAWIDEGETLMERVAKHREQLEELRLKAVRREELSLEEVDGLQGRAALNTYEEILFADEGSTSEKLDMAEGFEHELLIDASESAAARERDELFFADTKDAWLHDLLSELVERLDDFGSEAGTLESVTERFFFATELERRTIDDYATGWKETLEGVRSSGRYPLLAQREFRAQVGLIPLGADPDSGLYEFLHLATHQGPVPERNASGQLQHSENDGVVLVLLPGGPANLGAQIEDPDAPNYDPEALRREWPIRSVEIEPFFMAKHELTQGQWAYIEKGASPSFYQAGIRWEDRLVTLRNPVESVNWFDCERVLLKADLMLPSDDQWEYAARAGTTTIWPSGSTAESLQGWANLADRLASASSSSGAEDSDAFSDGYRSHAPVGSFRANAFGLHDVIGNVFEWCRDGASLRFQSEEVGGDHRFETRMIRGGAHNSLPNRARAARRGLKMPHDSNSSIGLRAMREIR